MDDRYFYMLLDKGDSVLLDGSVKYHVTAKDDNSIIVTDAVNGDVMKLTGKDIETYFWKLDELSELTVEYSKEKEARLLEQEYGISDMKIEYDFVGTDPEGAKSRASAYAERLSKAGYSVGEHHNE